MEAPVSRGGFAVRTRLYHPPGTSKAPRGGCDLGPLLDEAAVMDSGLKVFPSEKGVSF